MWNGNRDLPARGFSTPQPRRKSFKIGGGYSPQRVAISERKKKRMQPPSPPQDQVDLFHVIHKVPAGDSPYVKAKQVQLIEKDPSRAISLFWAAINSGDRVDSALKDMAVVMKQLNRSDEAVEAIKSFRHLCSIDSQESLDNVLVELYKRSGRLEEQIELLEHKLKRIDEGIAFGGRRTKTARSQGKKIQITIEQERSRLLGNLAWAYLQQNNFITAEGLYRTALSLGPDKNKECNIAICWMHMNRMSEAKCLLNSIKASSGDGAMDESYAKSFERASEVLSELESPQALLGLNSTSFPIPTYNTLKEDALPIDHVSGLLVSRKWEIVQDEETVLINEQHKGSPFQNQIRNRDLFPELGFGNLRLESGLQPFIQNGEGTAEVHSEIPYEKRFAFPEHSKGHERLSFTEPRRSSWNFSNNRYQRRGSYKDAVGGCVNRKLSFDQHTNTCSVNGNWRSSWRDVAQVKNEAANGTSSKFTVNGEWKSDSLRASPQSKHQICQSNSSKIKKSWADMVEEDEQQEVLSLSFQMATKCGGEEFHNENLNYNIIHQTPPPPPPPPPPPENAYSNKNFKSLELRDGRNSSVRRSLPFDQEEVALGFDGYNNASGNERECRRKRLQVFKDITLFPDSPRA